ncbi:hypothetical protein AYO21_04507 [Fonsecaea monophora]|uniref:Protein kinase domain-containing protein n=1 Tax=Fonsecaea monophora TaxID=254056 RepID=A0A177FAS6_9EURO|nr:hypothetical protein AYO21_04507 [Fonsecaea monophora]OAG41344.1 hypothetical protein AYO21_04507 [Fonsecaea monophora]
MAELKRPLPSAIQDAMTRADMQRLGGQYVGEGGTGAVFLINGVAVKVAYNEDYSVKIQHEKNVFERLGNCDGVIDCFDLQAPGIRMTYMANADLRQFLARNRTLDFPPPTLQLSWFRQMARALAAVHERRVLVADISARNFLVDKDLSIKLSDFSESSILDIDCNVQTCDDSGYTIHTEIGQLGAVLYETITGDKCSFDLYKHQLHGASIAEFPLRDDLPSTQGLWLGHIIEKCWNKEYATCHELSAALESEELVGEKNKGRSDRAVIKELEQSVQTSLPPNRAHSSH